MNFIDPSTLYYQEKRANQEDSKPPKFAFAKDKRKWQSEKLKERFGFSHGGTKKKKRK